MTALANLIFTRYLYPFEITSALLITAAVGAMVLAHRERISPKPTQRELAAQRVASGRPDAAARPRHLRPAQRGRYARAAPDGSQSELSVSAVLTRPHRGSRRPELPGGTSETGTTGSVAPSSTERHEAGEQ